VIVRRAFGAQRGPGPRAAARNPRGGSAYASGPPPCCAARRRSPDRPNIDDRDDQRGDDVAFEESPFVRPRNRLERAGQCDLAHTRGHADLGLALLTHDDERYPCPDGCQAYQPEDPRGGEIAPRRVVVGTVDALGSYGLAMLMICHSRKTAEAATAVAPEPATIQPVLRRPAPGSLPGSGGSARAARGARRRSRGRSRFIFSPAWCHRISSRYRFAIVARPSGLTAISGNSSAKLRMRTSGSSGSSSLRTKRRMSGCVSRTTGAASAA
jgi:hypothetical protein